MLRVFSPKNYKLYLKSLLLAIGIYFIVDSYVLPEIDILNDKGMNDALRDFDEIVFESVIEDYEEYTKEVADIIDENSDDNVFAIYGTYLAMQNNGFMSYGNFFSPTETDSRVQVFSHLGINVAIGNGVCRHQSDNLYRIFTNLGYECERVTGEGFFGDNQEGVTNHQVLYVRENGYVYLLDPANNTVFVRCGKSEYVSIMDTNFKFVPRLSSDRAYDYDNANLGAYFNTDDRSYDLEILRGRLERYINAGNELGEIFLSEEATRLYDLERQMYDSMRKYEELIEEIQEKSLEKGL